MNKPGFLLYKCRKCSKVSQGAHAPDGLKSLLYLLFGIPLPKEWGGVPVNNVDICNCDDGCYGVSDLIGFSKDSIGQSSDR